VALDLEDTIVGPATAPGSGCRGIARMSGPLSRRIARQSILDADRLRDWDRPFVVSARLRLSRWGQDVAGDLYSWPEGHSYTRQAAVEFHTLACQPLLSEVLTEWIRGGARLARPGEFTLRAFLAGRLDLIQAEAVLGLIQAESPAQLSWALDLRTGGLSRPITTARNRLLDLLADLEAGLDFADEDLTFVSPEQLTRQLEEVRAQLDDLLDQMSRRSLDSDVPRIVLVGPANAGKSSLLNALAGEARALISPRAGTTRDYVSAILSLDNHRFELIDTAGLVEDPDALGLAAARQRDQIARSADLIVMCVPVLPAASFADSWNAGHGVEQVLRVRTKADLVPGFHDPRADCSTSVVTPEGIAGLQKLLAERLEALAGRRLFATARGISERCRESLEAALAALEEALALIGGEAGAEYIAVAVREALAALGEVVGAVYTDDLLDRVFSKFCIGK
jgi:tRNA modification GTPase